MTVLYDHQIFTNQEYGGISRYFNELIERFPSGHAKTSVVFSNNAYLKNTPERRVMPFFPGKNFKGKRSTMNVTNKFNSIKTIRGGKFDIFHPTYYDPYFIKHLKGKPYTATFYDMIHEKLGEKYPLLKAETKIFNDKKALLDNASKVIAISESTKKDMMDVFGVDGSKIEIIYLGSSFDVLLSGSRRFIDDPYILFVGTRGLYKNFSFMLEAIAPILHREKASGLKLLCAGGGGLTQDELKQIESLQLNDLVIQSSFDDAKLANFYKYAALFIFPSEYEGFGIPVLEALSCNCPSALSNTSSLPEIGGDAALYFNPADQASIYETVNTLLMDEDIRQSLKVKGAERAKTFSWDKTYAETLRFYKSLL